MDRILSEFNFIQNQLQEEVSHSSQKVWSYFPLHCNSYNAHKNTVYGEAGGNRPKV